MGANTSIAWTHHTFNPWRGCSKVHAGCANCYAERDAKRFPKNRGIWGGTGTRVNAADAMWRQPIKWHAEAQAALDRHRVFCASLADVFEDWDGPMLDVHGRELHRCPCGRKWAGDQRCRNCGSDGPITWLTMNELRRDLFDLIDKTPALDWLLVTKRPENIRKMWAPTPWGGRCASFPNCDHPDCMAGRYRGNVWLLTSVSDQATADAMIPALRCCRDLAPVLGISAEPLLGPIVFKYSWMPGGCPAMAVGADALRIAKSQGLGIDWVILGGESGPKARPCNIGWIRHAIDQCRAADVAVFVKQLGSKPLWPDGREMGLRDDKGGDPSEWASDLRVREYPMISFHRGELDGRIASVGSPEKSKVADVAGKVQP